MRIVNRGAVGQVEYGLLHYSSGDRFEFFISTNGSSTHAFVDANTFGAPSLTTWYYVQAKHSVSDRKIYIRVNNGAWDSANTTAGPADRTGSFAIGKQSDASAFYWDGLLNQVAFWKALKSDSDLDAIYNGGSGLAFALWDVYEQEGYRFRDDDGSESAATWLAAQDTPVTVAAGTTFRLRVLSDTDTGGSSGLKLQYRADGGPWKGVT